nr:hypothetical protein [Siccirubricoccus soli]
MGVLILAGTVTLVVLLVQRAGGGMGAGGQWELALEAPEGSRIAGVAAAGDGAAVLLQRPDGERVVVVDPKRGRVVGEIRLGR